MNLCGPDCFPTHDDAEALAADLARLGVNAVRFHHMDSTWSRIFDARFDDTRHLDAESMDRLDYLIAALKKRGIYANINLNVGRHYKKGDGVRDYEALGYGKSATFFNRRLIELQEEYARQLLTHTNAYTGKEYRHEPAVALVEIINENSVIEGWLSGRLAGGQKRPGDDTWGPIPPSYAEELTDLFNDWLTDHLSMEELAAIRKEGGSERVPRLLPSQFDKASGLGFRSEARFYRDVERAFFARMKHLLKDELGVEPCVVGTADHNDSYAAYAHIQSNLMFDVVDGHGYWEHPEIGRVIRIKNTPMVNDPTDSTVTQFARTPVLGPPVHDLGGEPSLSARVRLRRLAHPDGLCPVPRLGRHLLVHLWPRPSRPSGRRDRREWLVRLQPRPDEAHQPGGLRPDVAPQGHPAGALDGHSFLHGRASA